MPQIGRIVGHVATHRDQSVFVNFVRESSGTPYFCMTVL